MPVKETNGDTYGICEVGSPPLYARPPQSALSGTAGNIDIDRPSVGSFVGGIYVGPVLVESFILY
jgi:hypothetical protein